jgi:flagellar basal body-associated protein FliL
MTTGQNQPKKKTLRKQIILVSIVLFLLVYLASTWLGEGGRVQKFSFLLFFI